MIELPMSFVSEHSVEYSEELAHAGGEGHFFGLASCAETLVEILDDGIESCSDQGSHVQDSPQAG